MRQLLLVTVCTVVATPVLGGDQWWSFQPLRRPALPAQQSSWVRTPIDAFIRAKLNEKNLVPASEADRRRLIRRLTFDLHGLPPAPEEIDAFVNDRTADAYERLIDRLLSSPRYGERWGRHWLDVVHYGDTHGYDKDKRRDHAWPYRDYVIRSFNRDKPYSQFIKEQIAGDVLFPDTPDGVVATGFIACGPWDFVGHVELREGTMEKEKTRSLDRDDMVANAMSTFGSLTVHCARCHDHKFDPIPQKDYYRLQAVFAGLDRGDRPYGNVPAAKQRIALENQRRTIAARHNSLTQRAITVTSPELIQIDADVKEAGSKLAAAAEKDRDELQERVQSIEGRRKKLSESLYQAEIRKAASEMAAIDKQVRALPKTDLVYAVLPHPAWPIRVLQRGNVEQPGEPAGPGALSAVKGIDSEFKLANQTDEGRRRAALAEWIANPHNPLTWRSIVNRVWHYHFGRGLVDTPNDFGRNGSQPTHPELLDWLAADFRDNGQSLKKLHRLILNSAVYRQSSQANPEFARIDADNRYLWRMNRQRLDAESTRDAVLAVSGKLDPRMGGPGFELFRFKDDHSPVYDHTAIDKINDPKAWRRTVYRFVVRSVSNPFLECLDCADPNINTPVRNTTVTALQALALLNDPFIIKQSEFFADRLKRISSDPRMQIEAAYQLALARAPAGEERERLVVYAVAHGLVNACRLILNANEFVFVD